MPEVRRNLLRAAAAGCRQHSRHRYPALYERFRSVLYLHDYVRPNTKHRGVSTSVEPRRRARMYHVGSATGVAHGHAIHQLEHHGQLRMMPGDRSRRTHNSHTLTSHAKIQEDRGSTWISIVMVLSANVVRVTVVEHTRARLFITWSRLGSRSFSLACIHTNHTHQAHPEANAHKYVLDFTRFGLIRAAPP
jgi:hypothetical protein